MIDTYGRTYEYRTQDDAHGKHALGDPYTCTVCGEGDSDFYTKHCTFQTDVLHLLPGNGIHPTRVYAGYVARHAKAV